MCVFVSLCVCVCVRACMRARVHVCVRAQSCFFHGSWIDMTRGKFELNSWPAIAKEWFLQKERGSDPSDATSMLRKGLPRAFPDLREIKEEANKEGTQYLRRVFMAPVDLMNGELYIHS